MIQANVIATSGPRGRSGGRRRRAPPRQDGDDHARQPAGHGVPPRARASTVEALADAAQLSSLADETPEGRSIVVLAKEKYGIRERDVHGAQGDVRPVHRADPHERRRSRRQREIRKGAADAIDAYVQRQGRLVPRRGAQRTSSAIVEAGRHAARRRRRGDACSASIQLKDIVKGGIKERFAELRAHGDQDGDDHRRQPADRRRDRRRGGRRRLPRAGHARDQARAHPRAPEGRAPRRDDRRRHERRAGARAGRRRRRDEHRHAGREGGRQHGRPRLEPDEAHRGRRDRQAAPHDARRAHDVQHRQRRRQVLRDHPGGVRDDLPGARTRST